MGLGYDTVIASFHQDYASYDEFRSFVKHFMSESVTEMNTFLINLGEEKNTLPPTFMFLSREMMKQKDKNQIKTDKTQA
jgi:hypothetical protein